MPPAWLKIRFKCDQKKYVTIFENTTGNSEIQFFPYKLPQASG